MDIITRKFVATSIVVGLFSIGSVSYAQSSPLTPIDNASVTSFDKLYIDLKKQYDLKDYKSVLSTIDSIKSLVETRVTTTSIVPTLDALEFDQLYSTVKYPATLTFGDHVLKIFASKDIFISGNDPKTAPSSLEYRDSFIGSLSATFDDEDLVKDVYCKIDGETQELHYQSNNPKVITVSNREDEDHDAGRITIHGVGSAIVTVTLDNKTLKLPIKVTMIPIYESMLTDDLIKLMGLPDRKTMSIVEWPDAKYVDGIRYEPSASAGKSYAEHWFYNKYPKVVFAVDTSESVLQVHDTGW